MRINDEHFQHNSVIYCLTLKVKYIHLQYFVDFFETLTESIVYFEAEETNHIESKDNDIWQVEAYLDYLPEVNFLQNEIDRIAISLSITPPKLTVNEIKNCDWVNEVQKTFVPINAGMFFIHSSNYNDDFPMKKINIKIDAGSAFGTGEHETTSNCLIALSELAEENYKFINSLDMGCGSGILAIAIAKLWPNQITAVDIDEQAVKVARENFHNNRVGFIVSEASNGFSSKIVNGNATYQLIVANILANPLIEMAKDAYAHLQNNGIVILAGFLNNQKTEVISAYKQQGFIAIKEIVKKDWPALVMQKLL